jgi:very-short-patch-repair endonuclease
VGAAAARGSPRSSCVTASHRKHRSDLERRFVDVCRDAGLPLPAVNASVAGFEVDALWPAQRLIVELDGYQYHRTRRAFESDRVRDAELQLAGYRTLRITHRRLVESRKRWRPPFAACWADHLRDRDTPASPS